MTDIHPAVSRAGIHATQLAELGHEQIAHALLGHAQVLAARIETRPQVAGEISRLLDSLIEAAGDVAAVLGASAARAERRVTALAVLAQRDTTPPQADACRRLIDGGLDVLPTTLVDESDADLGFSDDYGGHWRIDPYGRIAVVL